MLCRSLHGLGCAGARRSEGETSCGEGKVLEAGGPARRAGRRGERGGHPPDVRRRGLEAGRWGRDRGGPSGSAGDPGAGVSGGTAGPQVAGAPGGPGASQHRPKGAGAGEGVRVREAGRSAEPGGRRYRCLCVRELHAQDPVPAHARDGRDPGAGGGCDERLSRRHRPMDLRPRPVRFGGERTAARNDKAL